jgi:hypothetical protein
MPTDLQDRISGLIDEVGRIERESETVYLELGRLLPRLSVEMERGADKSESSFAALSSLGGLRSGAPHGRVEASFIESAIHFFSSLQARDSSFLARINEGISRLGALEEIISRVRADSEEMEIISLNAMTVALKSGAQGKAFSVITDELKRLSGRTIALSEGVTASGRFLLGFFGKLRNALAELDDFQRDFFALIDKTLRSGYEEMEHELSEATTFFSALLGEARSVRDPVFRVMGEIQHQDIVRQSLQHVGISLEEAREAAAEDPTFVSAVAELSGSLVEEVVGRLDEAARSFGSDVDMVSSIVGESERKRAEFLRAHASVEACADSKAFEKGSERYLVLKRGVVSMASRLTDHVAALDGSFKSLAELLSRFQNIVVASRIEVAKTKALAGVATTVGGMITLTGRIETDVGQAMDTTKDFTRIAVESIGGYSVGGGAGWSAKSGDEDARLVSTLREVEEDVASLSQAQEALRCAISDFSLYTGEFIGLISGSGNELGRLRDLIERLRAVGARLRDLESSIGPAIGRVESQGADSERLRRMVERFTIFTHKKTAGTIGRFAVEEGGEAGEVTLF